MTGHSIPWPAGVRKTRPRMQIWALLEQADGPMDAAAIHACLCAMPRDGGQASLSSVYRTLELFSGHGLLNRTSMADGSTGYELATPGHRHYAMCKSCNKTVALPGECPIGPLDELLGELGFHVTEHRLQLFGYCSDCLSDGARAKKPGPGAKK